MPLVPLCTTRYHSFHIAIHRSFRITQNYRADCFLLSSFLYSVSNAARRPRELSASPTGAMIRDSLARERPEVPLCKMGTTGLPIPQIGVGAWPTQKTTGSSWLSHPTEKNRRSGRNYGKNRPCSFGVLSQNKEISTNGANSPSRTYG